jgi:spore germination protein YaaH
MKRLKTSLIAIIMMMAVLLNMLGGMGTRAYAEMTPADKLLQNEKLVSVSDRSYRFKDLGGHWAQEGMYRLSYLDILRGFDDGTMKPDKTITRAEFIVMLTRAIGLPMTDTYPQYYKDIDVNHWSYRDVEAAKNSGIIDVFNTAKLNPTKTITREEMAMIAAKVSKDYPLTGDSKSFKDLSASYKYMDSIRRVTALGIIQGLPDGSFNPYGGASRAEAAVIIQRVLQLKSDNATAQADALKAFGEDYEKSSMTNPNQGSISQSQLNLYSMGKEQKQNAQRSNLLNTFEAQSINLSRSMTEISSDVKAVSDYLAEVTVSYKLAVAADDDNNRQYNVKKTLLMKKEEYKWLVYDSQTSFTRENIVGGAKINLAWQYLSGGTPNMSGTAKLEGLNVISPTWFHLSNAGGDISSIANVSYSNWAHSNGYQVWALVGNDFDKDMTSKMLSNPTARAKAINQLLQYAKDYKLDGINVDFENMYTKDKNLFTQFVKELYDQTKAQGILLSVDVTVITPNSNWSECYDRKALAQVSDYIALMAYDQYWSGSPVSGSVSQLSWVESHVNQVLKEVPKEKLLLGMPFYTRVWKEVNSNGKLVVTSSAVSMQSAEKLIADNNAARAWDAVSGQYYATYKKDGATYKIWLEDENSIKLRVKLANKYELAGVAAWKMGFEKPAIWSTIASALGNKED